MPTQTTVPETDREIAREVDGALRGLASVPRERIQVSVNDRWVTLKGTVDRWSQREAVERAVRRVADVRGCLSAITVRGGREREKRDRRSAPRRWRNRPTLPASC